jgi:MFS family permease
MRRDKAKPRSGGSSALNPSAARKASIGGGELSGERERDGFASSRVAWTAVAVLTLIAAVAFLDRQVLALLVAPLKKDLGLSDVQIGILQGFSFVLLYATAGLPLGYAVDRYSRRLVIFFGVLAWSVATVISGFAQTYQDLLLARICVGLGEAALAPAAYSMLSDLFPKRSLAVALSVFNMGLLLGSIIALLASGALISAASLGLHFPLIGWRNVWQSTFLIIGAPGCLFSLLIFLIPEPVRRTRRRTSATTADFAAFLTRRRAFLTLHFMGFSMMMAASYGISAWSPVVLQRVYGWSVAQVSVSLALLFAVAGIGGLFINGRIVDGLFSRGVADAHMRYFVLGGAILALASLASLFTPSGAFFVLALIPIKVFVNFGGVSAAAIQIVTPTDLRGRVSSLYMMVINIIGVSLGPAGVAWITDKVFHDPAKVGLSLGIFTSIVGGLAAIIFAFGLKSMREAVGAAEAS